MSSIIDITMPSLGADMTEGSLVEWQAKPGDWLDKGDVIAVIESHKGAIEMEVYHAGLVKELLLQPVVTVPVGTALARMEVEGTVEEFTVPEPTTPKETEKIETPTTNTPQPAPLNSQIASPVVRKLASERQLDLGQIKGSGPGGAILLRDLPEHTASKPDAGEAMRSAIAAAMEKANREIPHYYLSQQVDISKALLWLKDINAGREPEQRILLLALLLKAAALALAKYPQLNGYYVNHQFTPSESVHIGNVISLREGGLVVPAIHDIDQLTIEELMTALRDITNRSRGGVLRSSELTDATITVTSMGERGSDEVFGIIYPPQVAIIGFGRPRRAVTVVNDKPAVSDIINISLGADHRVSDGITGAKFLNTLARKLEKPEKL